MVSVDENLDHKRDRSATKYVIYLKLCEHTSIIVIKESESTSGPTDAASTVKLNLEAKSSLDRVSTYREVQYLQIKY